MTSSIGSLLGGVAGVFGYRVEPEKLDEGVGEEAVGRSTLWNYFEELSEKQTPFIQEFPFIATVYAIAGTVFGFSEVFTIWPIAFVKAATLFVHGSAILWNVWNNGGLWTLVTRAVDEAKTIGRIQQPVKTSTAPAA